MATIEGMKEHCTECNNTLENGQIGKCNSCIVDNVPELKINAFCLGRAPSDEEDDHVEGIYAVQFNADTTGLSVEKLAAMALDIFHSRIGIGTLDDFTITVLDGNDDPVEVDDSHEENSASSSGIVEKITDTPYQIWGSDENLTADDLDCKYNQDGNGEHPVHTRSNWREAAAKEMTISGYWDWLRHMIVSGSQSVAVEALKPTVVSVLATQYLAGDSVEKIGSVMMSDIVGEYKTPDQVPEWDWVQKEASFAHARNGDSGIWEFMLNLSRDFQGTPNSLELLIAEARQKNIAYLLFHQGT
jgi:hypothetical protein